MRKKDAIPDTFKGCIQKMKFERERRKRLENVQLDDSLDHYIWNAIGIVQYQVILGDSEKIANLVPKKEYSLVIADIPHGYTIHGEPYTYQDFNKVVKGFLEITTSPLSIFLVFHLDTQLGLVLSSFKGKANSRRQLYW